jgi:methionyl-tRNA formyltransferase
MSLKIIFMGTPEFAVPILQSIYESGYKILCVYTQPPKKKGRGQKINLSPIHEFSNKIKLKVRHPETLNSEEEQSYLKELNPDIVVVVAYGKILPLRILEFKNVKFINIHASLLPKWRGAAPIQRSIMNLDKETGISIMKIMPKLDTGPVMLQSRIKIFKETNFESLSKQMSQLGSELILKAIKLIKIDNIKYTSQIEKDATYAKKIDKKEAKINWNNKACKILAKINALHLNPGTWFELNGLRIKILKAIEVKASGSPGEILDNNFTIACSENAIQVKVLKKEGKQEMLASEFLKGNIIKIGNKINIDA